MRKENTILRIPLDKLLAHPENPNRMSKQNFEKLKRHLKSLSSEVPALHSKRCGGGLTKEDQISNLKLQYEPLIVRRHPEIKKHFEIINGHHRANALRELGETFADCIQWNVDDDQVRILLATLNRLGGKDELATKAELIKSLSEKFSVKELSKLLPDTKAAIEKLKDITKQLPKIAENPKPFLNTLVFFLDDEQIKIVEAALEAALRFEISNLKFQNGAGKSEKMAKAITVISKHYLKGMTNESRTF